MQKKEIKMTKDETIELSVDHIIEQNKKKKLT